ncbi:uncharacterized protein LOC118417495 [Branchiostoma floridae]|uniref:Uncharacterized protein LOC118417495 n=1 Tax=Branchiostoma floridae TaxID=7739 RepID=A0A9J7LB96_BRAFL|nr:uncharacterized protein LOC118417495 [Branchiostoma floridae]
MEQARKIEQDCDTFVRVFMASSLPQLRYMFCRAGLTAQEVNRRVASCQAMVLDSLWHWAQQDRNVNLLNIGFFRQSPPHVRAHIAMQRFKQPHPQPPMTILLDQIRLLCHRDQEVLEFVRDLNFQMSYSRNCLGHLTHIRSNSFSCAALCRVQGLCTIRGQRAVNIVTWGGSVPLPRHLKEEYINYASRYIWHPLVGLQVLLNGERSPSGQMVQVVPANAPFMLLCSTYTFNQHHDGRVVEVYPCSYCRAMFPSTRSPKGYVHYTLYKSSETGESDSYNRFSKGNCAECAAFSAMFHVTKQTCRIVGADPRVTVQRLGVGQLSVPLTLC